MKYTRGFPAKHFGNLPLFESNRHRIGKILQDRDIPISSQPFTPPRVSDPVVLSSCWTPVASIGPLLFPPSQRVHEIHNVHVLIVSVDAVLCIAFSERRNALTLLVVDTKLVCHKDGAQIWAQHGPKDRHGCAYRSDIHLEDDEENALGAVPCGIPRRIPAALVVDRLVNSPYGEGHDTEEDTSATEQQMGPEGGTYVAPINRSTIRPARVREVTPGLNHIWNGMTAM